MFTGIIEGMGTLAEIRTREQAMQLGVTADFELAKTRIGDSIAVNGACLTVTALHGRRFTADVSPETLSKTTFVNARVGQRVNLERALRLSDRLDGHLVSGHVDGVALLSRRQTLGNVLLLDFSAPPELTGSMILKGSVAVDGVSLTINRCDADGFQVSLIPHTSKLTTLGFVGEGHGVNIETDMIGKYVELFLRRGSQDKGSHGRQEGVSLDLLARAGFVGRSVK